MQGMCDNCWTLNASSIGPFFALPSTSPQAPFTRALLLPQHFHASHQSFFFESILGEWGYQKRGSYRRILIPFLLWQSKKSGSSNYLLIAGGVSGAYTCRKMIYRIYVASILFFCPRFPTFLSRLRDHIYITSSGSLLRYSLGDFRGTWAKPGKGGGDLGV